jgi:DNA polymerase III delta prime subunit
MADKPSLPALVDHSKEVKVLKDIVVPDKYFNRMKMDVQVLDELFGGPDWPGILPGTSILFTGMPGAGKSTAGLQFADLLQKNAGRNILYNAGEEPDVMVKMRSDRIGLTADFGISMIEDVDELIRVCKETGVEVLFQDSLQTLSVKGDDEMSRITRMKLVTKKLHKFAKDDNVTIWIIGHITKGGDFAGPMEIKHDLDVHAHIRLNPETAAREFQLLKNRFGPALIPYECNLGAKGLDFAQLALVEKKEGEEGSGGKAGERKEAVCKLIKEQLLKGEKISAYCLARFEDPFTKKMGVDCSGGFWRSMLERVAHELKAEGHVVSELRINNRLHYVVEV